MNITVVTLPETAVVRLRCTGPYGGNNRNMMERLKSWARERGLLENGVILGVAWDDPVCIPPEQCRYDVCLGRIPGGRYACFLGAHTPSGVQALWETSFAALQSMGSPRLQAGRCWNATGRSCWTGGSASFASLFEPAHVSTSAGATCVMKLPPSVTANAVTRSPSACIAPGIPPKPSGR